MGADEGMIETMHELYKTEISNTRWWAYDIPGNIGWMIYLVCLVKCLIVGTDRFSLLAMAPAILMLIGVIELVGERIAGLDRVLPKIRVWRGFGALTLGGVLGGLVSIIGLAMRVHGTLPGRMLGGAVLCAVFAGLCFRGYRKPENGREGNRIP